MRHALPVRAELLEGRADPQLSDVGHEQARRLGAYLAGERLDALYCSPLRRAVQTAAPVAAELDLRAVIVDEVAEFDADSNEYVPVEELKAAQDPRWTALRDGEILGGVEDPSSFRSRVIGAIEALIEAHPSQRIAVVCHGMVINVYLAHVLGLADGAAFFYPNYTSIHRVAAARSGERSVVTLNETAHLRGSGLPIGLFQR